MSMKTREDILVVLTPGFPASESDTTCLPSQQLLVRALNRNFPGTRIVIFSLEYPLHRQPYTWYGNKVYPFNTWVKSKWYKMRVWVAVWKALRELQRSCHVLGIFSWWCGQTALIGKWFGKRSGIPHFIWILGQDARKGNRYVRWIRPRPEELVTISHFLAEEFYKNYNVWPAHTISNAIDTNLFDPCPAERDIDVLGVGSLIPLKRYDLFITAVEQLARSFPHLKAVICGKGPEMIKWQETIDRLGLHDHISLVGELPHKEVLRLMQRAKVLLHPSSYEGYSTVCLEALYAGAFVCSFCHPGIGWVRHWHVAENMEEMIGQVRQVLEDPVRTHDPVLLHSMDECAREVMSLYIKPANIRYYDAIAAEYDSLLRKDDANRAVRQAVADRFVKTVPKGWVLDFGGGTGLDMEWLTANGYNVIFCEPSAGMRQQAIEWYNRSDHRERVVFLEDEHADFRDWAHHKPFEQEVDAVLSNFAVMNSIRDIHLLFSSLSRVIKSHGHVFALVLDGGRRKSRLSDLYSEWRLLTRRRPSEIAIQYHQYRQSVFLHRVKMIKRAAANWFELYEIEPFEEKGFSLLHFVRKGLPNGHLQSVL